MRILAIDGSPRKGGSVSGTVESVAVAAEAAGADVIRVRLYDKKISHCRGCMECRTKGECVIPDDLLGIAEELREIDGIVLGSPSYYGQMNAAMKGLFDRLVGYLANYRLVDGRVMVTPRLRPGKRAVLVTACTASQPQATLSGDATGPLRDMRRCLSIGGVKVIGSIAVTDTWRKPEAYIAVRQKADSLGRRLATPG